MYLYGGDLPELPPFDTELRLGFGRPTRDPDMPPRVRCTVTAPSGAEVTLNVVIPVQQWEAEAISSGFVVKQSRGPVTGLSDPAADVGSRLFDAVFHGDAGRLYAEAVQAAERARTGLTLRVVADDPVVLDLPWEVLYDRSHQRTFLALSASNSVLRSLEGPFRGQLRPIPPPPLRGVILAGDRRRMPGIAEDIALLRELVGPLEVDVVEEPTRDDVRKALQEEYDLVHFAGTAVGTHGGSQALLLPSPSDPTDGLVDAASLREYLDDQRPPSAIVLSACNTDRLAAEISRMVPVAVGMRGSVSDQAAVAFNRGFYPALLDGASVPAAVAAGRTRVASTMPGDRGWAAAVVYAWHLDPVVQASDAEERTAKTIVGDLPAAGSGDLASLQRMMDEANLAALERLWGRNRDGAPALVKMQWEQLQQRLGIWGVGPEVNR
jgi:hypothetical protein